MPTNDEINSRKRIIARYLNGDAYLQEGTTTASSVLQLVDQIEDLARADENKKYIRTGHRGIDELGHYELFKKHKVD